MMPDVGGGEWTGARGRCWWDRRKEGRMAMLVYFQGPGLRATRVGRGGNRRQQHGRSGFSQR